MKLEEIDEEILTQGSTYQPKGDKVEEDNDEDILDSSNNGNQQKKITDTGIGGKAILIIGGLILIILIGAVGVFAVKKSNDKHAEELLAQLEAEDPPFTYTGEQLKQLRTQGFTGDEIEQFQIDEIPFESKMEEAEADKKAKYDKDIKPYLDGASDEFNQLLEQTWLYGPDLTYDVNQADTTWYRKNMTLNLDYDKIPAKGIQCFVRLTLKERTEENEPIYMFMMIDPIRYAELPQSGNIVVYVEYYVTDQGTVITHLEEKRVADK